MCGFIGLCDHKTASEYNIGTFLRLIKHRGPDSQNTEKVSDIYSVAFTRLAIIDLEGGNQPMHSGDGNITVMCNGEVYNYIELREKLKAEGTLFHTASDTEVVLRLYEKYGIRLTEYLEGMYAISIVDKKRKCTYLIRDRFGIKPLYYTWKSPKRFAYASEIKPLLRLPFVSKNIRRKSVADFLAYEYIHAPYTIFEDIKKVFPGHYLVLSETGIEDVEYWDCADLEDNPDISVEHAKKKVVELMRESLTLHLRSDVKLGFFLSGGLDSGLITAFASEQVSNIDTYTLRFEHADYDESGLAEQVAKRYHTKHHNFTVNADDFSRLVAEMLWYFDEPLGDSGILPNYILNRLVRENDTKVILTGAGGDELFAGYGWYFGGKVDKRIARHCIAGKAAAQILKGINPDVAYKIHRGTLLYDSPVEHLIATEHAFRDDETMRLCGAVEEGIKRNYGNRYNGGDLNKTLYMDIKTYLADDLLLLADRACMAYSVEGRVPFLYKPLVEYAMSIPAEVKTPGGNRKWLLREIAKDYLPDDILYAPKMGFSSPVQTWQRHGLGDFAYQILNSKKSTGRSIWKTDAYKRYVSNKGNYRKQFNKIFLLFVLEVFFRVHIDNDFTSADEIVPEKLYG